MIRSNLKGGAGEKTTLWTNPNEYAIGFPAQTVSLDLSGYDAVVVTLLDPPSGTSIDIKSFAEIGDSTLLYQDLNGTVYTRELSVSASGIAFAVGKQGSYENATYAQPRVIYGIKY